MTYHPKDDHLVYSVCASMYVCACVCAHNMVAWSSNLDLWCVS